MMFAAYGFVVQFVEIKSNARWNQELICSQKKLKQAVEEASVHGNDSALRFAG